MNALTIKTLLAIGLIAIVGGCATSSPETKTTADATGWHKDKDIQRVWLAPGFDFSGYDGLYIGETIYAAKERSNETEMRTWAMKYLREQLAAEIPRVRIIPAVYLSTDAIPANAKILKLENTIYEYEKGGGGARYFVGIYGGGQPVIKVRGVMTANDQPVFKYEASRSGESAGARVVGAFKSDQDIQHEDIKDLAFDLADFIRRTATHVSK
jgi:hypothetical protein